MKNRLRVWRAEQDITQDKLAKAIGVSRQTINAIEGGEYVPSAVLALKLAHFFKVSVHEIFSLDEKDGVVE